MPHLYLVDGSGYIFRAYHRLPPLTNIHGEPVGAVYGYTTMLWKLADALHKADGPTHMAVILDKSSHTFRNELYDQYKAHRPPPPEDLVPQFPMIRDATRAFSLPCIEEEGLEADDIIACYTQAALAQGWRVTIVSSDKDLMQLMTDPSVDMLDTMNNRTLGPEYVQEKFGVGPEKLGDVLALMGDAVDNVPGVPGVGPKTAAKLLIEHGDLEAVLAAAPAMKPGKLRDNLIEHADAARLSKVLVTLKCDGDMPEPLEELDIKGIPDAPLARVPRASRLQVAADQAGRRGGRAVSPRRRRRWCSRRTRPARTTITRPSSTEAALDRWIDASRATRAGSRSIPRRPPRTRCSPSSSACRWRSPPTSPATCRSRTAAATCSPRSRSSSTATSALAKLKPLFEDPSVLKIGHNLKYDLIVLARLGRSTSRPTTTRS